MLRCGSANLCVLVRYCHAGLQASRVYGFLGLGIMFVSSLVPAGPNYLHISQMDTITPCCAPRFNFVITTLLQDLVGIACSGLFAARLLPVLLIVVPSMVRACTLLLVDDIERRSKDVAFGSFAQIVANYADPAFSRSNVHSVLALASMMTPIFTAIPMTVIFQFLRHSDKTALLPAMVSFFYAVPIALGLMKCNTVKSAEARYLLWLLSYFGPLIVILIHEAMQYKTIAEQVTHSLLDPLTYIEVAAEVFITNVILSDIMYANLYVEQRSNTDERRGSEAGAGDKRLQTMSMEPEPKPEPEHEIEPTLGLSGQVSAVGLSRQASPEKADSGYEQVLREAELDSRMQKLLEDDGLESLASLREASRDDLIKAGFNGAQGAAVFAALGRSDAGLLQAATIHGAVAWSRLWRAC